MKKLISAILALTMVFTVALATPVAPINSYPVNGTPLATYGNISFAELIRAIVVAYDGKELPELMDTHYATPYMLRAQELGIIARAEGTGPDYDAWNADASRETMNSVLTATAALKDADMQKIVGAINDLLVDKIIVDGKEIAVDVTHMNGSIMLPVRAISEALGYTVSWEQATYTATVNTGKVQSKLVIGDNTYYYTSVIAVGMSKPSPMESAPRLLDGKTIVPLAFFNLIADATAENGILTITSK